MAPTQDDPVAQREALDSRLRIAVGIRDRARASGDAGLAERARREVDELLDLRLAIKGG